MLLSKSCVYGLRATLYLAMKDRNEFTPIKKLSEKLEISFHYENSAATNRRWHAGVL